MRILVVEDDDALREVISKILEEESFQVDKAADGEEGLYFAETGVYDALIIDIMLPELDGISLIKQIRKRMIQVPAIFVTAKDSVDSRVAGLNAGADDYLVKPFAIEELLARVRALVRRNRGIDTEMTLKYGPLVLQPVKRQASVDNEQLTLTAREYDLLEYFVLHKGQILTREQIFNRVWGIHTETIESVIDLYVHYLRKKLSPSGLDKHIRTIRSVGYMLREE
ncbi:response regulator transcription factor [Alicyclobacillus fastidiosus]|uniref:Response regulator transcription factor n=1 Tax=Alicyclobacillus fastidiosus TaxID=392011 RepID=A0ABY6ZRK3_9BACL|nr:response regulator transcription factor [Alicyclobacillus fastidiosus]WAH44729.1 response regulator transcription factor [Alicyclobacillus fastidiosus]